LSNQVNKEELLEIVNLLKELSSKEDKPQNAVSWYNHPLTKGLFAFVGIVFIAGGGWWRLSSLQDRIVLLEDTIVHHAEREGHPVLEERVNTLSTEVDSVSSGIENVNMQLQQIEISIAKLCQAQGVDC